MPRGTLEVVEYVPRQATTDAVPPDQPCKSEDLWGRLRLEHRTLTRCTAGLLAAALHLLFVAPVLWGGPSRHPPEPRYRGDAAMQWVVLEDSSTTSAIRPPTLGPPALMTIGMTDAQPELPLSSLPAEASDARGDQAADPASFGVMYGRYVGQIRARIDRAWQRPRTAIGAPIFQCQVQVDQDGVGRVREVMLVQCNGDARWQVSLVHAIEAASPLPAPPSATVFTQRLLLDDLLGVLQNESLNALGCRSESCHALATVVITAVAPEAAKGTGESEYTLTQTVENNLSSRPYLNSPLTIQEIQSTGLGVPDPGGLPGALRYDAPSSFNGSNGTWQLVVDPSTNVVYHFLFTSGQ